VLLTERRGAGRHRQPKVVVADLAASGTTSTAPSSPSPSNRQQEPSAAGVPVDVEVRREPRPRSVLEHVPPPRRRARGSDADVVGTMSTRIPMSSPWAAAASTSSPVAPPRSGSSRVCTATVVPVLAAGLRRQDGRQVDPVHAEVVEVGQPLRRLEQVEGDVSWSR
jgi:hypothetical protein